MPNAARRTAPRPASPHVSDVFDEDRTAAVAALTQKVFGRAPRRVAFPGGKSRSAFVADMGDAPYVLARRESENDAQLEAIVLKNLSPTGLVPRFTAIAKDWIVQEHVDGRRLPLVMDEMGAAASRMTLIGSALDSLAMLQEAAHATNLHHRVPRVGTADRWLWNRTGAAKRISRQAGIEPPPFDREALVAAMDVKRDEFVKWDARPGNAMVCPDRIVWFDWEDCGRSKALDDLAFVLCDEWTALDAASEAHLLAVHLPRFNRSLGAAEGERYLRLFGVTHMILRLRMALKLFHRDDRWWDRDYCLAGDKVGVTAREAHGLTVRIRRWGADRPEFAGLCDWLDAVEARYGLTPEDRAPE